MILQPSLHLLAEHCLVNNTYRRDDKGVSDVRRVVNAEADDEDDGDAGDGVDGETPEVDDANDVDQGEGDTGQHHQANLGGGIQLQRVPSRINSRGST